jgi:hypothetical protein
MASASIVLSDKENSIDIELLKKKMQVSVKFFSELVKIFESD